MSENRPDPALYVSLLGPFRLRHAKGYHALNLTGSTRELLAFLLTRPGDATRRELLVETFWPETTVDKGRSALTTALWRIKKMLSRVSGLSLETFDDLVMISADDDVQVDVVDLQALHDTARRELNDHGVMNTATRRALGISVRQSAGLFLDGVDAHWVLVERERMTALYIAALRLLMKDAEARHAFDDALDWGRKVLATDPLREAVHHDLIALYAKAGERRRAILQYETLWEILRDELGIEPDPATRALRDRILERPPEPLPEPSYYGQTNGRAGQTDDGDAAVTPL